MLNCSYVIVCVCVWAMHMVLIVRVQQKVQGPVTQIQDSSGWFLNDIKSRT